MPMASASDACESQNFRATPAVVENRFLPGAGQQTLFLFDAGGIVIRGVYAGARLRGKFDIYRKQQRQRSFCLCGERAQQRRLSSFRLFQSCPRVPAQPLLDHTRGTAAGGKLAAMIHFDQFLIAMVVCCVAVHLLTAA